MLPASGVLEQNTFRNRQIFVSVALPGGVLGNEFLYTGTERLLLRV
jgi:hypothetical protein